jgi:hypothetical protein
MMGVAALLRGASAPLAFGQSKQQLGSGIGPVVPKQVLADPLYNLTSDMFRENLNTKFSFSLGDVKLGLFMLIAVNDLNPPTVREHLTNGRECFSLVFQGPRNLPLRQETYTIQQSRLGSFQLLLVPGTSKDAFGPHYEAVINRLFP